jgi:NADPH:quinone reductase-like Zn-dependent oxidoreductase
MNGQGSDNHFSHEVGGVVKRLGSNHTSFQIGDRVVGFSFENFSSFQCVNEDMVQKVKPNDPLEDLAGLPMAYATALYGLKHLASLQAGDRVLILSGTGLAGIAAAKVALALGAKPFVLFDSEDNAHRISVAGSLELNPDCIVSNQELLTTEDLYGYGIVISSSLTSPDISRRHWRYISQFGRFINIGPKTSVLQKQVDVTPFTRGASYFAFNIPDLYRCKPQILAKILEETLQFYRENASLALFSSDKKDISSLNQFIVDFSNDFTSKKTIIRHEPSENFLEIVPASQTFELRSDATYFLVGCIGGLGRNLKSWMSSKGAKNFAFLSRSGADSEDAAILVNELRRAGKKCSSLQGRCKRTTRRRRCNQSYTIRFASQRRRPSCYGPKRTSTCIFSYLRN